MRGVGVKENPTSSIQDRPIFFLKMQSTSILMS
jgi:hypothetical protein